MHAGSFTELEKLRGEVSGTQDIPVVHNLSVNTSANGRAELTLKAADTAAESMAAYNNNSESQRTPVSGATMTGTITPCTYRSDASMYGGTVPKSAIERGFAAQDVLAPGALESGVPEPAGDAAVAGAPDGAAAPAAPPAPAAAAAAGREGEGCVGEGQGELEADQKSPFDAIALQIEELGMEPVLDECAEEDAFRTAVSKSGTYEHPSLRFQSK